MIAEYFRYGGSGLNEAGTDCSSGVKATFSWSTQSRRKDTRSIIKDVFTFKTEIVEGDESWSINEVSFVVDICAMKI